MTTADGKHQAFSGRHPKLFIISDLYRVVTEIAEVHADIARSFLKCILPLYLKLISVIIASCFVTFEHAEHSLEHGETPSHSASHQASNYVQRSLITQNVLKRFGAVAVWLRMFFKYFNSVLNARRELLFYALKKLVKC